MKTAADFALRAALAVSPAILPFAILSGLVLAAVALSFLAFVRARTVAQGAVGRLQDRQEACESASESLRQEMQGLARQISEIRQEPPAAALPLPPQSGFNLSKRSQALRLYRRGTSQIEIAAALGLPAQEVDLLLKVHRIVISKI